MQLLFLVLALLIGDTAAGLAGRLAGSLALAAAAVLCALAQIAGLNGLDMLHDSNLHRNLPVNVITNRKQSQQGQRFVFRSAAVFSVFLRQELQFFIAHR